MLYKSYDDFTASSLAIGAGVSIPSNDILPNQLAVVFVYLNHTSTTISMDTPPSGWTLIGSTSDNNAQSDKYYVGAIYKVNSGSTTITTEATWNNLSAIDYVYGVVTIIDLIDVNNPIDDSIVETEDGSSSPAFGPFTVTKGGNGQLSFIVYQGSDSTVALTYSDDLGTEAYKGTGSPNSTKITYWLYYDNSVRQDNSDEAMVTMDAFSSYPVGAIVILNSNAGGLIGDIF